MQTRSQERKGHRTATAYRSLDNSFIEKARIFDVSEDPILLWRQPGGIQFWNKGATNLYGFTETEALNRISHQLLKTEFPVLLSEIEKELRVHGSWHGKVKHISREGRTIIVSSRYQVVSSEDDSLLVLESNRDITEMEQHLREQAIMSRFSLDVLQATSVRTVCDEAAQILARELEVDFSSVFELTPDGKKMRLCSGYGWRAGTLGRVEIEVSEETPKGRALQLDQPIVIEDVRLDQHVRLPQFMRDHKVISSMAVVIHGRDRPFGVLGVDSKTRRTFTSTDERFLEDVSNVLATAVSRLQFEQKSLETGSRLKGIVETAVDGILTIDEAGTVESMNPAAERIFGYRADEVIGHNISILMPEPYRSEHDSYLERYRRTGERRIIGIGREVRGQRKDGSSFPMDLAVSVTHLGSRRIFTGLVRDITIRKRLEQEILEISEYEQRRIGSDLHDDLCQQLAGLRFGCDALKKTLDNPEDTEIRERLDKIATGLSRAIDHTRMLAHGMAPVALEKNGLTSALHELSESISKLFGIKCTFQAKSNVTIRDVIAATHLYRIAQEAMNNALKHGRATAIAICLEQRGEKATLTIKDNGCGFTLSAVPESEGIGLRTVRYRAGMIPAEVKLESAPGHGTSVSCTFSTRL